jgi:hypothetical protein
MITRDRRNLSHEETLFNRSRDLLKARTSAVLMDKFPDEHVEDYAAILSAWSSLIISCYAQEILQLLGACASAVLVNLFFAVGTCRITRHYFLL